MTAGRSSSDGTGTRLCVGRPTNRGSISSRNTKYFYPSEWRFLSRSPIIPSIHLVPWAVRAELNQLPCSADQSPSSTVEVKNEWSLTSIPAESIVSCLLSLFLNDRLTKDHVVALNVMFALEIYPKDGRSICYNRLQNCTKIYGVKYQMTIILIQPRGSADLTNKCGYHIALQISHVKA